VQLSGLRAVKWPNSQSGEYFPFMPLPTHRGIPLCHQILVSCLSTFSSPEHSDDDAGWNSSVIQQRSAHNHVCSCMCVCMYFCLHMRHLHDSASLSLI